MGSDANWRSFAVYLTAGAAALALGTLAIAYIIDPFDTGRSTWFEKPGVRPQGPRTAGASRGRDLSFNAGIFGNSHIQLVSPDRLRALTGLSFVQLSIPATGPREQFALMDWFIRHHPTAKVLVIGADRLWCTADPALSNEKPFPFWLYSSQRGEYVRGLLRYHVLEEITRRAAYLLSKSPNRARQDGYWDYEPIYSALGYDRDPLLRARLDHRPDSDYIDNRTARFPAAERLSELAETLPDNVGITLVFPPIYKTLLPEQGSPGEEADRNCKAALTAALGSRVSKAVVDWRRERPELHAPELFFDQTHYRRPLAERVEREVAQRAMGAAAPREN
ncbi:MAG: hypothetical protein ABW003_18050 [Microvirga sp.]|jgi:hypothetical protein